MALKIESSKYIIRLEIHLKYHGKSIIKTLKDVTI